MGGGKKFLVASLARWISLWAPRGMEDEVHDDVLGKVEEREVLGQSALSWLLNQSARAPFVAIGSWIQAGYNASVILLERLGSVLDRVSRLLWLMVIALILIVALTGKAGAVIAAGRMVLEFWQLG